MSENNSVPDETHDSSTEQHLSETLTYATKDEQKMNERPIKINNISPTGTDITSLDLQALRNAEFVSNERSTGELNACLAKEHSFSEVIASFEYTEPEKRTIACTADKDNTCVTRVPCSFDQETKPASVFCTDCFEYLCEACWRDHRRIKLTRKHHVLSLDDNNFDIALHGRMKELLYCQMHPDKVVSFKMSNTFILDLF